MDKNIEEALSFLIETGDSSIEKAEAIAKIEGYILGLLSK